MPAVKVRSSIDVKVINAFALQRQNVYPDFAIRFPLEQFSQCKRVLLLKFFLRGKSPTNCIADS
jgi:hypothetical protein